LTINKTKVSNMEIKIEKNVPMENDRAKGVTAILREMEVGDSFVVAEVKRMGIGTCARQVGIEITTRKQPDGTVRVWRTA